MKKKRIRVLHIAFNDLGNGGIQNQIMAITKNTCQQVDNDVVVWSKEPAFYDSEFKKYGCIHYASHYNGNSTLKRKLDYFFRYHNVKKAVFEIIKQNGPYDVVHSHKLFESAACLSAAYKAGVPIRIAHAHLTASKGEKVTLAQRVIKCYNSVYRRIIRKRATHMIGCSRNAADYVFGKNHGEVVHIGIDLEKFNIADYHIQPNEKKRLLHVGNFSVHKNQLFLIEIFKELKIIRNDVEMVLVGRGGDEYKKSVEKMIQRYDLINSVIIKPHDSLIPKEIAEANAFVFPSNFEGFGIVLVEAQAMGLKCFASTEVPLETNCGLVSYLDLNDGAKKWAIKINDFLEKETIHKPVDVTEFSEKTMSERVFEIYSTNMYDN